MSLVQVFWAITPEDALYFANPGTAERMNSAFFFHWADRPKTQKSILKVEETHHSPDVLKDKVGINMNIEAVQDTKMENDRRSETVFGQSVGETVRKLIS